MASDAGGASTAAAPAPSAATPPTAPATAGAAANPSGSSLCGVDKAGVEVPGADTSKPEAYVSWVLKLSIGRVAFSRAEAIFYVALFRVVNTSAGASVGGKEGAHFLRRSGLATDHLREIWRIASGGKSKPRLTMENWFLAMKLVALGQKTGKSDLKQLVGDDALQLDMPDLGVDPTFDLSIGDPSKVIARAAIGVEVSNPVTEGSGIQRHTNFTVSTQTALDDFPNRSMCVVRRYRDFTWLHNRLCYVFPGVVIPPVPGKKLIGNMEEAFVEERRAALQTYLNHVVHHPRLVKSFDVQVFLGSTQEGLAALQFIVASGVARARTARTVGDAAEAGAGVADVFANLWGSIASTIGPLFEGTSLPADIGVDDKYKKLCAEHTAMHERLRGAVEKANAVEYERRQVAYEVARLGTYVIELGRGETKGERAGSAAYESMKQRQARRARDKEKKLGESGRVVIVGADGAPAGGGGWVDSSATDSSWDAAESGMWAGASAAAERKKARDAERATAASTSTALIDPMLGVPGHARAAQQAAALFEEEEDVFGGRGAEAEYEARAELNIAGGSGAVAAVGSGAGAAAESGARGGSSFDDSGIGYSATKQEANTAAECFRKLGATLEGAANRLQDQLDAQDKLFYGPLRFELENAQAVKEAMARREAFVRQLAAGHASLKHKKKTYAQARANSTGSSGAAEAEKDMFRAEDDVAAVERNVAAITDSLKLEMTVRDGQRRNNLASMMLDHVRAEARHAKLRGDRWLDALNMLTQREDLVEASIARTGTKRYSREDSTGAAVAAVAAGAAGGAGGATPATPGGAATPSAGGDGTLLGTSWGQ